MLRLAYRRRKLLHVPTITMLPESQPRQGFVEEADFRAIVKHLEPGPALAATIAFETAWRIRSEVLTLEWSRVDLDEGCIRLDGAHVFVHTDKGPLQGQRQREFNKAWRSACRRAGYTGTLLHNLRRSGVRAMVRSGTPESVCMKISGHATAAVLRRYDIASDQDLRDARATAGHSLGTLRPQRS